MPNQEDRHRLVPAVAAVVAIGWLFSLVAGAEEHDWTPLTITTPVMLLLAGYAFGVRITRGKRDDE